MTEEQCQFALDLKMDVLSRAYQLGQPGDPDYEAAFKAGLGQLQNDRDKIRAAISAGGGKQVLSVNAGESVTWSAPMSLQDQLGAYTRAIMELMGFTYLQNRTSARFLY
jgi:hypothetical protein